MQNSHSVDESSTEYLLVLQSILYFRAYSTVLQMIGVYKRKNFKLKKLQ
jgi:hypothetical protein